MNNKIIFKLSNYIIQCHFRKHFSYIYKSDKEWIYLLTASNEIQDEFLQPINESFIYNDGYNNHFLRCNLSFVFFININYNYKRYKQFLLKLIYKKIYYPFQLTLNKDIYIYYIANLLAHHKISNTNINIINLLNNINTDINGQYYNDCLDVLSQYCKNIDNSIEYILYHVYSHNTTFYIRNRNMYNKNFMLLTLYYTYIIEQMNIWTLIDNYDIPIYDFLNLHKLKLLIYNIKLYKSIELNMNSIWDIIDILQYTPYLSYLINTNKIYSYIQKYVYEYIDYDNPYTKQFIDYVLFFYKNFATEEQKIFLEPDINRIQSTLLLRQLKQQ